MRRIQDEPRIYKHHKLMNDYNDLQIRIKVYLFGIGSELQVDEYTQFLNRHPKPTAEEISEMSNRIMAALQEDSEPMIKRHQLVEFCDCEHPRDPYNGTGICMTCKKKFGLNAAVKLNKQPPIGLSNKNPNTI